MELTAMTSPQRVLDLGCGTDKLPGAVGMDVNPASHADVIHDLDVRPWPFEDDSFDFIRAQDVLEHVGDFFGVMAEIHRVARPNAVVEVRMPFMSSRNYATDPTHRRPGTSETFDYFDPSKPLGRYRYTTTRFTLMEFHYSRGYRGRVGRWLSTLDRAVLPWIHKHHHEYELYFAYLYPMLDITYKLRADKSAATPSAT